MRLLALLLASVSLALASEVWLTDLDEARRVACREKKDILIDFTGTDWCAYCIRLREEVYMTEEFSDFAKKYVLVELDYPHHKPQAPEVKARNLEIQNKFGVSGFPTVILMDAKSGEAYGRITGYLPGSGPKSYLVRLSAFTNSPEVRAKVSAETKAAAAERDRNVQFSAKTAKAIADKNFDEACRLFDQKYEGNKALASINKALASEGIEPANKARALKWIDQAISEAEGDERLIASFRRIRSRIEKGSNE